MAGEAACERVRKCTCWYMTEASEQPTKPGAEKTSQGAIAQLGERLPCTQEVVGSIPSGSTNFAPAVTTNVFRDSGEARLTLLFNNLDQVLTS